MRTRARAAPSCERVASSFQTRQAAESFCLFPSKSQAARGLDMKRLPPDQPNSRIHREHDFSALSRLAILLFLGLALTGGFLFAARQHFAAIDYGYKTEELRREQQRLLAEQRQLLLAQEEA